MKRTGRISRNSGPAWVRGITRALALAIALVGTAACSARTEGPPSPIPMETARRESSIPAAPAFAQLPERPTADDYVAVALDRNPRLERARLEAEARGYRVAQVTTLSDPILRFVPPTSDMTQTAAGEVSGAVGISQKFELPAKLGLRGKAAGHEAAAAFERYRATALEVTAEVRRAYYGAYFADRAAEITEESRALMRYFRDIAARKYEAGVVPQQDLLRAQLELANLENELIRLRQSSGTARARLKRLMALAPGTQLPRTAPVAPRKLDAELTELTETAATNNPSIAEAHERVKRAESSVRLARLAYVPDITVSYDYTAIRNGGTSPVADGDDNWRFGIGFNLPLWFGRLDAGVSEARSTLGANRSALADARDTTTYRVEDALLRVEAQQRLVGLFAEVIVPEAKLTLDATVSAYRSGQVDFLTLVESWRRVLGFQISYHKSLSAFEEELAELERVVGQRVATVATQRS